MNRRGITVVLPAFDEADTIGAAVERVADALAVLAERYEAELLVVDDGSTDATPERLAALAASRPAGLRVVTHERNRGLAAAIETGIRAAAHETIVILDADLSYAPEIVERLVVAREAERAAAALASPYMVGGRVGNVPFDRLLYSRAANAILSWCVGGRIKTFTGMVRAYDRAAVLPVLGLPRRGEFNTWILAQLLLRGERIVEVPAALVWPAHRTESPTRMSWRALRRRMAAVLETMSTLRAAGRTLAKRPAGRDL
jgi:glycosyltransferase involved in cell wall biosynthesis